MPPVDRVYHSNPVPVAVSAVAVAPWQYVTGELTVGAAVTAVTFTTIDALGPSQFPVTVVWLT